MTMNASYTNVKLTEAVIIIIMIIQKK